MNLSDEDVLNHIINEHPAALAAKFREGMRKYSTPLIEKDCLSECMPEAQDLVVYLSAATLQKRRAAELARILHGYHLLKGELPPGIDSKWLELLDLLEPKRLAVKKPS